MPYVNVRITKDGVTAEQKTQIVAEITDTLVRVLGKRPETTHIVIDEIEPENWGFGGMLTTEYRKRKSNPDRRKRRTLTLPGERTEEMVAQFVYLDQTRRKACITLQTMNVIMEWEPNRAPTR